MKFAIPFVLCLAACGGSGSGGSPAVIALSASGVDHNSIVIPNGGQVHFVNNDTADHSIASDCTEVATGKLTRGQGFTSPALTGPKDCPFSDSLNPSVVSFQGHVIVKAASAGGGGSGY